jgi:hypothetical protein
VNQPRPCPHCGHSNFNTATFCAACGARVGAARKGSKVLIAALAVFFVGLLWAAAGYKVSTTPTTIPSQVLSTQIPSNSSNLQPSPASLDLTSAQHLAEARRALADGYKPNRDPKKAAWGAVAVARWHLKAIGSGAPEYGEAQELLKEVVKREKQIELASKVPTPQIAPAPDAEIDGAEDEGEESSSYTADTSPASSPSPAVRPSTQSTASERTPTVSQPGSASSDDYYTNTYGERVRRPTFSSDGPPAGASAQCRDGSYSFSRSRRGTCSHHGGVARWL